VFEAVGAFGVTVVKHHVDKPSDEDSPLLAQVLVVKTKGRLTYGLGHMAIGHRPHAPVPGAVLALSLPVRNVAEVGVVGTASRNWIGGPEGFGIKQVTLQARQVTLVDNVGKVRIEANSRLDSRPGTCFGVDVKEELGVRIPHVLSDSRFC
jgi:hypothetical protein